MYKRASRRFCWILGHNTYSFFSSGVVFDVVFATKAVVKDS